MTKVRQCSSMKCTACSAHSLHGPDQVAAASLFSFPQPSFPNFPVIVYFAFVRSFNPMIIYGQNGFKSHVCTRGFQAIWGSACVPCVNDVVRFFFSILLLLVFVVLY